jgi:hypothetical protein
LLHFNRFACAGHRRATALFVTRYAEPMLFGSSGRILA